MPFDRYRSALRAPGVGRLLGTSLVARLPNGMSSLAILLLVTRHHGYGRAGLVTAVYVAAAGASNLALSRAADRVGPRVVLLPTSVGYAAGMSALALVPGSDYGAELVVAAATGLSSPPVVSVVRGLWPQLFDPQVAQAVYGLEATAQELIFISGPAIVALVAAAAGAPAAVALTGALALVGTWSCALAPQLARPAQRREARARPSLRGIGLPLYVGIALALTVALNMSDVGIVAFVSGRHASAGSGAVLAVWSLGSLVGGLVFGAGADRVDDVGVARATVLIALSIALAAAAPGSVGLGVIMFAGGATIAPGLARLYARVGAAAPSGASTEAFGWVAVGLLVGSSIGAALGGLCVDVVGPRATFLLGSAAPLAVALVALARLRLRRPRSHTRNEPLPS